MPDATVVNGAQLMLVRLVQDRTLAAWVMVGVAADAALGATMAPAVAARAVSDARANLVVLIVGLLIRGGAARAALKRIGHPTPGLWPPLRDGGRSRGDQRSGWAARNALWRPRGIVW